MQVPLLADAFAVATSRIFTTFPIATPPTGAVHVKNCSPPRKLLVAVAEADDKNALSVNLITVPAGIATQVTNEKPSGPDMFIPTN